MMVMPANPSGEGFLNLVRSYPGKLGWIMSPSYYKDPHPEIEFVLDNGAYGAYLRGEAFDSNAFLNMLNLAAASKLIPRFAVVPDCVADAARTIEMFKTWHGIVKSFGFYCAFAAQDGIEPEQVPKEADVVFIGGTTKWKWSKAELFCKSFKRVHIGRVNNIAQLEAAEEMGCESIDGSGWFRETVNGIKGRQLINWAAGNKRAKQINIF